jgi:hypothetical protein
VELWRASSICLQKNFSDQFKINSSSAGIYIHILKLRKMSMSSCGCASGRDVDPEADPNRLQEDDLWNSMQHEEETDGAFLPFLRCAV